MSNIEENFTFNNTNNKTSSGYYALVVKLSHILNEFVVNKEKEVTVTINTLNTEADTTNTINTATNNNTEIDTTNTINTDIPSSSFTATTTTTTTTTTTATINWTEFINTKINPKYEIFISKLCQQKITEWGFDSLDNNYNSDETKDNFFEVSTIIN